MANVDDNLEAESWKFLPKITEDVARMHESIQNEILQYGRVMRDAGVMYVHVINAVRLVSSQSLAKSTDQIENKIQSQPQK